jgi:arylformamidase
MIFDLSHEITAGMTTYPGLPVPELQTFVSREQSAKRLDSGVSFEIDSLSLVGNTGTYMDAPFHFHADLPDIGQLPLNRLVGVPISMVRAYGHVAVTAADFGDLSGLSGHAVLVHTGWDRYWGTPRYLEFDCPHLTAEAVEALVDAGAAIVGIDSLNIDNPGDPSRPAHQGLLGAGIPIIEHLTNLGWVPDTGARLTALPAPVRGMASFPVRAVAVVDSQDEA